MNESSQPSHKLQRLLEKYEDPRDKLDIEYLVIAYKGVAGLMIFGLAILTLLPLTAKVKTDLFALVFSVASIVYIIYHLVGLFVWLHVWTFWHFERRIQNLNQLLKFDKVRKLLSMLVLFLLVLTICAKARFQFGERVYRIPLPPLVYSILGVSHGEEAAHSPTRRLEDKLAGSVPNGGATDANAGNDSVAEGTTESYSRSYLVAFKWAIVTSDDACGDGKSSGKYRGIEPQWLLQANGELLSKYEAVRRANFRKGQKINVSGSIIWAPKRETDLLRFEGEICELDGEPPQCMQKGSIQQAVVIVGGKVKQADGKEPKVDNHGFLVLNADISSGCRLTFHVEIVPTDKHLN